MGARNQRATFLALAGLCIGGAALAPGQALADELGAQAQARAEHATEEIIAKATRLRRAATGQDVHVHERQRIKESDQSTVTDFLQTLREVSLNSVESTYLATTACRRGANFRFTLRLNPAAH